MHAFPFAVHLRIGNQVACHYLPICYTTTQSNLLTDIYLKKVVNGIRDRVLANVSAVAIRMRHITQQLC